ncbi:MAG: xanthine dehydrogenase family protein molybdopterin-binding subunit [Novosphingobium sp.]|nr:xanthine dehydrogenase family protein molybdopterin-binding subunit [Novosphingobium sp.]
MSGPLIAAARFIGERLPRKEDARLLTGRGTFVDDVILPGMLHAAFVRSPIASGMIRSIDTTTARELPGVRAIYTARDLTSLRIELMSGHLVRGQVDRQLDPLAIDRVQYVGDPVAVVVADDRYIAEDAVAVVVVDYEELPPVVTLADARNSPPIFAGFESNVAAVLAPPEDPEIETIFASAPHVVERTITHPRVAHCSMETRGVVVSKNGDGEVTVHMGCQSPKSMARYLAKIFPQTGARFRVISKDVGGSFGLKSRPWREDVAVIASGLLLGRPIKWIEDRLEALTAANQAREQECTIRIAFGDDGKLLASKVDCALNNGAYPHYPDSNAAAMMFVWACYKQPKYAFRTQGFYTNTTGLAAYRGPWAMESLARETMLDIAARQMGHDPIALRRNNLITAADLPHTTSMGLTLEDVTPSECLEKLLTKIDVAAFRAEQAAARKGGRYLGLGVAVYVEPTATSMFPPMATEVAVVRVEPNGKVSAALGTHSQGQGTQTTMAQIVADKLGVPFEDVAVYEDDSAGSGYGAGSGGSRQAVAGGGASVVAAERLLTKIKQLAAHLLNASPEAVRLDDGMIHVEGAPEMTRSLREIAEVAYGEPRRLPAGMEPGLEVQHRYHAPPITFASAAHACIVEVDIDTGFVSILRWVCSEDCGVVINPGVVEGQIAGGLAQAIGMVLHEQFERDALGNPLTVTFKDYHLPTITDVPDFEYTHIVTPAKGAGGFRGVGEGGAIIGPPTLINAIHDALAPFGVTCLDLPLSPPKLLNLIGQARGG